ncbi:MAG: hypothetical protein LAP39_28305 [Acidobacteriia bacterium]|nr:hypothetical protein [Terriglobia bacterium]
MNIDLHNLKMTDEELRQLEWCRANLEEEQIVEVEEEALEIAARDINAPIAAERLRELLVAALVRNAGEQRRAEGCSI